ncbi:quaternary ammonium compound efflux SMR transporter SugE [Ruficoccus amylovorans]|uniref:Guanidinium exporter n=1 Tax=Ruficoccus amylovorans TaxID=1804625 RepID=A0A842HGR2_9BACT|nr:quaternary ammonium compound efflux SMR transporter SugE [Ruficoccus amylovorans]MBC2594747.1 quaternary ammonium compound efflux SMR transporter SugE [Ruficoccus amylovorans]
MHWLILIVAGLLEVGWAVGLKYTEGFTRPLPTAGTVLAMVLSMFLLGLAMKTLPVGTAYAVWVGIGVVGTAVAGVFLLGEAVHWLKAVSLLLIVVGIVGLKMSAAAD